MITFINKNNSSQRPSLQNKLQADAINCSALKPLTRDTVNFSGVKIPEGITKKAEELANKIIRKEDFFGRPIEEEFKEGVKIRKTLFKMDGTDKIPQKTDKYDSDGTTIEEIFYNEAGKPETTIRYNPLTTYMSEKISHWPSGKPKETEIYDFERNLTEIISHWPDGSPKETCSYAPCGALTKRISHQANKDPDIIIDYKPDPEAKKLDAPGTIILDETGKIITKISTEQTLSRTELANEKPELN